MVFINGRQKGGHLKKKRKRLYVELAGGLGNQLSQAVAAMSLAKTGLYSVHGISNGLKATSSHGQSIFEINLTGLKEVRLSKLRLFLLKLCFAIASVHRREFFSLFGLSFYSPKEVGYSVSEIQGEVVFLRGYFQSHKYLENLAADEHPKLLVANDIFSRMRRRMESEAPIVVHIRRGDFARHHGILSPAYYGKCLAKVRNKDSTPRSIWIFSDDSGGLDEYLKELGSSAEVISGAHSLSAVEELFLMSKSNCLVIGNSTFALWAALIAENRYGGNVEILCPHEPYTGLRTPSNFYPSRWTRVESNFV
jgi:hypothetical protein